MNHSGDKKIVLTLDAGGTNFVFSAICDAKEIAKPVHLPANGHNLDLCLKTILQGFEAVNHQLPQKAVAISFAFPGPADYRQGIIGDLANLPAFRGGVALGPMLENHFQIPVFINNDGDLFVYGEARYGFLPALNAKLEQAGLQTRYQHLFGVTLGTGFGAGWVVNGELYRGENDAASEICLTHNVFDASLHAEESISARAIVNEYNDKCKTPQENLSPYDVYRIAMNELEGDREAALFSFKRFGEALGAALVNAMTLTDSCVVIGGGLANAWNLFAPVMLAYINGFYKIKQKTIPHLVSRVFSADDELEWLRLVSSNEAKVRVPYTERWVNYHPLKIAIVGRSVLGTNYAVALGAYAFALSHL